jgi:hypothetical protein
LRERAPAGEVRGRVPGARARGHGQHQRPQPGVGTDDVGGRERIAEHLVDRVQQLPHLGVGGRRVGVGHRAVDRLVGQPQIDQPVGLRQSEDVARPRSGQRHRQRRGRRPEPVTAHDQVRAPRRLQADAWCEPLRPDTGGVHHHPRPQRHRLRAVDDRVHVGAVDRGHRRAGQDPRAVRRGGAADRDHQPGVVHQLPVPEDDTTATGPDGGDEAGHVVRTHPVGRRQRPSAAGHGQPDGVAEAPTARGEGRHVAAGLVGHEEGELPHEVRRRRPHEDGAFAGALPRQPDLAVRQVPQPAVDELRRPSAGAGREVGALQQHHRQTPTSRVQRDPGAGHPAAHDDDVDLRAGQALEGGCTSCRGERPGKGGGHRDRSGEGTGRL